MAERKIKNHITQDVRRKRFPSGDAKGAKLISSAVKTTSDPADPLEMPSWAHLIRFVAEEDNQSHIGQLVDTTRDVGADSFDGREILAYLINGSILDGQVTKTVFTVKYVSFFPHIEICDSDPREAAIPCRKRNLQLYPLSWSQLQRSCKRRRLPIATSSNTLYQASLCSNWPLPRNSQHSKMCPRWNQRLRI